MHQPPPDSSPPHPPERNHATVDHGDALEERHERETATGQVITCRWLTLREPVEVDRVDHEPIRLDRVDAILFGPTGAGRPTFMRPRTPRTSSRPAPRKPRGARARECRPRARRTSTSRDDGDGPAEPPPLALSIVGAPAPESDAAIARYFERFLEREHPGTSWAAAAPRKAP